MKKVWNEELICKKLLEIIESTGKFPSARNLQKIYPALATAVMRNGGQLYYREKLGYQIEDKPYGYWTTWSNVEKELRDKFGGLIASGLCPNSAMLKEAKIGSMALRTKIFGGINGIAERLNCEAIQCLRARDGHVVLSTYELIFDEYLFSIGVPHTPNGFLYDLKYRYDQKVGDYYFEILGYQENVDNKRANRYRERWKKKKKVYKKLEKKHGIKLIEVEYGFFNRPHEIIERELDAIFVTLGLPTDRKHPFNIRDLVMGGKGVVENDIVEELKVVCGQLGSFPLQKYLYKNHPQLAYQIVQTGGSNYYRKLMGYDYAVKPNYYWTEERIVESLKEIAVKLGEFPTKHECPSNLYAAAQANGGLPSFAQKMGYPEKIHPKGYWTRERIFSIIDERFGVFPKAESIDGVPGLKMAISRAGGFKALKKEWEEQWQSFTSLPL